MKIFEPKYREWSKKVKVTYDPALDNLPIPQAALAKAAKARESLEKHPFPDHLLRGEK